MNPVNAKRWTKISLRTLHLLAVAGVGGGVLFGIEKDLWLNYWWLALASGALMMLMDMIANPVWIVQVRGPGKLRYYSIYHQKIISSDKNTKG